MMMFLVGVVFCHLQLISRAFAVPPAVKAPNARVSHVYRTRRACPRRTERRVRVGMDAKHCMCARTTRPRPQGFGWKHEMFWEGAVVPFSFFPYLTSRTSSASRHWYSTSRMGRLATAASRRASIGRARASPPPPPPPPPHRTASPVRRHRGGGRAAAPLPEKHL
jgi:hypothetical protein